MMPINRPLAVLAKGPGTALHACLDTLGRMSAVIQPVGGRCSGRMQAPEPVRSAPIAR